MKRLIYTIVLGLLATTLQAQEAKKTLSAFNHLDLGVTMGTTGIGLDVSTNIGNYVKLRTGFEAMPRFEQDLHFDIQTFNGDAENGNILVTKFDKLAETMKSLTGYDVDGTVIMVGKPTMWNFKFLVDVFPFRNKHWHFTTGFHWGPSTVATAVNAIEDAPSLFAVGMYNHLYDHAVNVVNGNDEPLIITGYANDYDDEGNPIQIPYGLSLDENVANRLIGYGRMGIHVGNFAHDIVDAEGNVVHKAGDPYYMEPDNCSMASAKVRVNNFKPYLGFGYGGRSLKNNDKFHVSFDAGLMFWGGTPSIYTHEGVDLAKDVKDIGGKVGDYVDLMSGFKVFPVLNARFTYTIF